MLDVHLCGALFHALPPAASILLVGDDDQVPPRHRRPCPPDTTGPAPQTPPGRSPRLAVPVLDAFPLPSRARLLAAALCRTGRGAARPAALPSSAARRARRHLPPGPLWRHRTKRPAHQSRPHAGAHAPLRVGSGAATRRRRQPRAARSPLRVRLRRGADRGRCGHNHLRRGRQLACRSRAHGRLGTRWCLVPGAWCLGVMDAWARDGRAYGHDPRAKCDGVWCLVPGVWVSLGTIRAPNARANAAARPMRPCVRARVATAALCELERG